MDSSTLSVCARARWVALALLASLVARPTSGMWQSAELQPRFEVTSIKLSKDIGAYPIFDARSIPVGRIAIRAMSLLDIIRYAYPEFRRDHQMEGGPSWLRSERFDIESTFTPGSVPSAHPAEPLPEPMRLMLRALLAERFALRVRVDAREIPVYSLVRARADGRFGPAMRASAAACKPNDVPQCGVAGNLAVGITAVGVTIDTFVALIGGLPEVNRPLVNDTGFTRLVDFTIKRQDARGVSIFAFLEEQYGLELEARRQKTAVLVIERAEMPTPN